MDTRFLCATRAGELEETIKYLRTAREKKTDGIVLVGSVFNTLCKNAEISGLLQNIPVVLANGKLELPNFIIRFWSMTGMEYRLLWNI